MIEDPGKRLSGRKTFGRVSGRKTFWLGTRGKDYKLKTNTRQLLIFYLKKLYFILMCFSIEIIRSPTSFCCIVDVMQDTKPSQEYQNCNNMELFFSDR